MGCLWSEGIIGRFCHDDTALTIGLGLCTVADNRVD